MGLGYGEVMAFAMGPGFGVVGGDVGRTDIAGQPGADVAGGGGAAE
jgi:hypothetical protein